MKLSLTRHLFCTAMACLVFGQASDACADTGALRPRHSATRCQTLFASKGDASALASFWLNAEPRS